MYTKGSELVVFMYRTGKSMNNLLSFSGLVDVRINTSDKDLPVILYSSGLYQVWADKFLKNCTPCVTPLCPNVH